MSDPKHEQREPDELELESETIKDLDVGDEDDDSGQIRGGCSGSGTISAHSIN